MADFIKFSLSVGVFIAFQHQFCKSQRFVNTYTITFCFLKKVCFLHKSWTKMIFIIDLNLEMSIKFSIIFLMKEKHISEEVLYKTKQ